jgi:hypothetical protein
VSMFERRVLVAVLIRTLMDLSFSDKLSDKVYWQAAANRSVSKPGGQIVTTMYHRHPCKPRAT